MNGSARWATPVSDILARLGPGSVSGGFPESAPSPVSSGAVWGLTGATGWWGRHFARELLSSDPYATLVVPVRAEDRASGLARIQAAWAPTVALQANAHSGNWWKRTHVLALRSLAEPSSSGGLPPWRGLDAVVHAAANTSLALTLERAWEPNVTATQRVWEWAVSGGARRFDHVSTLSVWVAGDTPSGVLLETERLDAAGRLWGGYAGSKWAAEAWLGGQVGATPTVAIHRLGLISYSEVEGWAPSDPLAASARAWARWGRPLWVAPAAADKVDWSPVDRTVKGVLAVAHAGASGPFHWASRAAIPAQAWLEALARRWGAAAGEWPASDISGLAARRAFGRWASPERARRLWWHDAFQCDRHRFAADRASLHLPRWTWSPEALDAALTHIPIHPGS